MWRSEVVAGVKASVGFESEKNLDQESEVAGGGGGGGLGGLTFSKFSHNWDLGAQLRFR